MPTAPRELSLFFTQKLEPAFSSVEVTDANGARVDLGKPRQRDCHACRIKAIITWNLQGPLACAVGRYSHDRGQLQLSGRSLIAEIGSMAGDAVDDPLIVIRAIHFAATAPDNGYPDVPGRGGETCLAFGEAVATVMGAQIRRVAWIGLAVTAASGAIWLMLEAAAMSVGEAITADLLSTVVNETQFGLVFEIRFVLVIILAACLAYDRLPSGALARAGAGSRACRGHRLDRTCRVNAGRIGTLASDSRRPAPHCRGGLDREALCRLLCCLRPPDATLARRRRGLRAMRHNAFRCWASSV